MSIIKLIFKIIWITLLLIISYPFIILSTPILIIFWSRLSHKVKTFIFSILKLVEPQSPTSFQQTEVSEEKVTDLPETKN